MPTPLSRSALRSARYSRTRDPRAAMRSSLTAQVVHGIGRPVVPEAHVEAPSLEGATMSSRTGEGGGVRRYRRSPGSGPRRRAWPTRRCRRPGRGAVARARRRSPSPGAPPAGDEEEIADVHGLALPAPHQHAGRHQGNGPGQGQEEGKTPRERSPRRNPIRPPASPAPLRARSRAGAQR